MPFSADEFFSVFARYNHAIWPLQIGAYVAGVAVVAALTRRTRKAAISIALILASMWAVNGIGYHLLIFSRVNPAARAFAVLFMIEATLLAASPWIFAGPISITVKADARSVFGLALIVFAALIYPVWGQLAGHAYPAAPVFGVAPCPTTIFTIGVLLMGNWPTVRWLLIIPAIWSAIGGSAAFLLGVPQDSGLIASGITVLIFYVVHWCNGQHPEHLSTT